MIQSSSGRRFPRPSTRFPDRHRRGLPIGDLSARRPPTRGLCERLGAFFVRIPHGGEERPRLLTDASLLFSLTSMVKEIRSGQEARCGSGNDGERLRS